MVSKELQERIEEYALQSRQGVVEDLKTLVRIPSISHFGADGMPFGKGCAQVLDKALELAQGHGLATQNCGYWYGLAQCGEGDKTIGLFSHLDVVPVGNNWAHDPFDPIEKDGLLIGRGVTDNKNAAVVSMYVMKAFRELGLPLRSKLSLFFGCSEETGMQDIEHFVEEQPMPDFSIVPDTDFPVCHGEKGIYSFQAVCKTPWSRVKELSGGVASNVVPDSAQAVLPPEAALLAEVKATAEKTTGITVAEGPEGLIVSAAGRTAHAARPQAGDNALKKLLRFLSTLEGLGESDRAICAFAADTIEDCYGEHLGIAFTDEPSGRLTCISGLAHTEEGRLVMGYNIRYSVTHKGELVTAGLEKAFAPGWELRSISDSVPMYLPADDPKVKELCRIYHEVTGKDATPYVIGGGTYARHLQNAVGFGMETDTPTGLPEGHGKAHEPDEAVIIDELLDAIKIYILSILEVDELLHR